MKANTFGKNVSFRYAFIGSLVRFRRLRLAIFGVASAAHFLFLENCGGSIYLWFLVPCHFYSFSYL